MSNENYRDLLGQPHALTPEQKRKIGRGKRREPVPAGYAALPGTGPEGETCKTCKNMVRVTFAKTYRKCGLMRAQWTGGGKTDVRARSPACKRWEKGEAETEHYRR